MNYDAIIIGAGAAGLMTAISAGLEGNKILIIESNKRPGNKILISGGGRCNFTNLKVTHHHFVSHNSHFCKSALSQFTPDDFIQWVKDHNIDYYEKTLGQLFCKTSSKQILNLLLDKSAEHDATLLTDTKIYSVSENNHQFKITTKDEEHISSNLVIATGGLSYPKLGASDFGYKVAKQFGHNITKLQPALDGFVLDKNDRDLFENLEGSSLEACIKVGHRHFTEPLLFTHLGLSGPVALKASLYWEEGEEIEIDFLPNIPDLNEWFKEKRKADKNKTLVTVLSQNLNKKLVLSLIEHLGIANVRMAEVSNKHLTSLTRLLKSHTLIPTSTVGYEKAEVTRGGVDTKDLSSKTMESKLVTGLFFVGEVVDVTGLLGGYNFQWAWSSGWVAGKNLR